MLDYVSASKVCNRELLSFGYSDFKKKNLTNFDYLSYNVNKANNWWPLSFLILLSVFKIMIHGPNCEISFEPEGRLCCSHSPHLKISPGLHWSCWRQRQGSDPIDFGIGRLDRSLSLFFPYSSDSHSQAHSNSNRLGLCCFVLLLCGMAWTAEFHMFPRENSKLKGALNVNTAKGTTDPRVEFSLTKLKQVQTQIYKSWSNFIFSRISTKPQLQNLNQT